MSGSQTVARHSSRARISCRVALSSAFRPAAEGLEGWPIVTFHEPPPAICEATAIYLKLSFRLQRADFIEASGARTSTSARFEKRVPSAFC